MKYDLNERAFHKWVKYKLGEDVEPLAKFKKSVIHKLCQFPEGLQLQLVTMAIETNSQYIASQKKIKLTKKSKNHRIIKNIDSIW
jgi:hypothetical protein